MNSKLMKIYFTQTLLLLSVGCSDVFFLRTKRLDVKETQRFSRIQSDLMCIMRCLYFTRCQGVGFLYHMCVIGEIHPIQPNIKPSQKQYIWIKKSVNNMYDVHGYLQTDAPKITATLTTSMISTTVKNVPQKVVRCPPNYPYIEAAGGCFMIKRTTYTYDLAQKECQKTPGSRLAALTSEKKRKAIKAYMDAEGLSKVISYYVRVGGRQMGSSSEFVWEDGQVWSWEDPKPWCSYYHPATPLDCVCFYFPGTCIMSGGCSAYQFFICEVPV